MENVVSDKFLLWAGRVTTVHYSVAISADTFISLELTTI